MFKFQVLVFLASLAGLHAGLIRINSGRACPPFSTKPDFDYKQYSGVWYEIKKIPNVFQDGMDCVRATYQEIGPNEISVLNTGTFADGSTTEITGSARQPNPDTEPGHLILSFPGRPDGTYEVLDTDYENWTAIYSCDSISIFTIEFAWIMSRTNTLSEQLLAQAEAVFTRNGIDVNKFRPTAQSDDCNYVP